jgi:chemotaxis regulatin CheY-phosphate phosphatase CheZ
VTEAKTESELLKSEMFGLFNQIQKIRHEIASIRMPGVNPNHFGQMSDELDAIVEATETATNTIMENVESIDDAVAKAIEELEDGEAKENLTQVPDLVGGIFEACSFQDITGQRVTKIINLLKYVEERINALISFWGEGEILSEEVQMHVETDEYKKYLHGPASRGEGVAQDSVDNFFEGTADEKRLEETEKESAGISASKQEALALGKEGIKKEPGQSSISNAIPAAAVPSAAPMAPTPAPVETSPAPAADTNAEAEKSAAPSPLQQDAIDALFD